MKAARSLDVRELSLHELGTILWNSECPIARQVCLDEMKARRVSSRLSMSNRVG